MGRLGAVCALWTLMFAGAMPAAALEFDTISIQELDTHGVVIRWRTDQKSNGSIYYGLGVNQASFVSLELLMAKDHYTRLFNLLEGEEYVFRIQARTETGELKVSAWNGFRTDGIPAPKITSTNVPSLTIDGGTVQWWSNIPVIGTFECGVDTSYGFSQTEKIYSTNHEVMVNRFGPRRRIYFRITARDARGLQTTATGNFESAENNIALGAKVTGTFIRNPERSYITDSPPIIDRVTDGLLNYFTGMATSGNPEEDTQWVEIDLGKVNFVGKILTYWRQLAFPKKFILRGSVDAATWIDIGDTFDAADGIYFRSRTGDPLWEHTVDIGSRVFRYIRMEVPMGAPTVRRFEGYKFVQLFELKVYLPEAPERAKPVKQEPDTKPAIGKPKTPKGKKR